ncbi:MAG: recombinase family protein [Phycisphaerales bacterium]
MKRKSRLNGTRGVPLLRCSTMEQADTSIDDQLNSIKVFSEEFGMELGEPVRLVGKSGSVKSNLEAGIDDIIARKKNGERIDYVVFYDQSRFARSGPMHFGLLAERLEAADIDLAETDGFLEDPAMLPIVRTVKAVMSQQQAQSIADASARGSQSALRNGRRVHSTRPAYGIDKLRMSPSGEPEYIIRRLADGTRLFLDPQTKEIKQTYPDSVRLPKKSSLGKDTLVPGDPALREIVIRIFRMRHEDGLGGSRIARALNDEGIPSPDGKDWSTSVVRDLLRNEVYTGVGYANRYSSAIYVNQARGRPQPLGKQKGKVIRGTRPSNDWFIVQYPALVDYLPPELKRAAEAEQKDYRDRIKTGKIQEPKSDNGRRHHLLSGIMTEQTSGKPMIAKASGKPSRVYYWLSDARDSAPANSPLRRWLPSAPLHRTALEEIESLICSLPDLRDRIIAEIAEQDQERLGGAGESKALLVELEKLRKRYRSQLSRLGGPDDAAVNEAIDETSSRIRVIEDRLASMNAGPALTDAEVTKVADGIIRDLSEMLTELANKGEPALRELAATLISSAVADLENEEVAFEFAIPADLIDRRVLSLPELCGPATCRQAYKWRPIVLDVVTIEIATPCRGDCWEPYVPKGCDDCRRRQQAA